MAGTQNNMFTVNNQVLDWTSVLSSPSLNALLDTSYCTSRLCGVPKNHAVLSTHATPAPFLLKSRPLVKGGGERELLYYYTNNGNQPGIDHCRLPHQNVPVVAVDLWPVHHPNINHNLL